jgi:hypothetical protein
MKKYKNLEIDLNGYIGLKLGFNGNILSLLKYFLSYLSF